MRAEPHDEIILDAFRSGFDTVELAHVFALKEPEIEAAIHRARTAEYERRARAAKAA